MQDTAQDISNQQMTDIYMKYHEFTSAHNHKHHHVPGLLLSTLFALFNFMNYYSYSVDENCLWFSSHSRESKESGIRWTKTRNVPDKEQRHWSRAKDPFRKTERKPWGLCESVHCHTRVPTAVSLCRVDTQ